MKTTCLAVLTAVLLLDAHGAEPAQPGGKSRSPIGVVTSRQGNCARIALNEDITAKPGEALLVGRSALLIALVAEKKLFEAWGDWKPVGRVALRAPRGGRHWLALIEQDLPPDGAGEESPPNILPGDFVYRQADAAAAPPDAKEPSATPGR